MNEDEHVFLLSANEASELSDLLYRFTGTDVGLELDDNAHAFIAGCYTALAAISDDREEFMPEFFGWGTGGAVSRIFALAESGDADLAERLPTAEQVLATPPWQPLEQGPPAVMGDPPPQWDPAAPSNGSGLRYRASGYDLGDDPESVTEPVALVDTSGVPWCDEGYGFVQTPEDTALMAQSLLDFVHHEIPASGGDLDYRAVALFAAAIAFGTVVGFDFPDRDDPRWYIDGGPVEGLEWLLYGLETHLGIVGLPTPLRVLQSHAGTVIGTPMS